MLIRSGEALATGWSRNMSYSGFIALHRSVIRRQTGFAARITRTLSRLNGKHMTLFDWTSYSMIEAIVSNQLGPNIDQIVESIQGAKVDFEYLHDCYAFESHLPANLNVEELLTSTQIHIRDQFSHFRAFHCARPVGTNSYYENGIVPLDETAAFEDFRDLVTQNFEGVFSPEQFEKARTSMAGGAGRGGHIYYVLDDRYMTQQCPHYLKSGSEYWQGLAVAMDGNDKLMEYLGSLGTPTVFRLNVPTNLIRDEDLQHLPRYIYGNWAFNIANEKSETWLIDFTLSQTVALEPEVLVDHYHPDIPA